jgi:hypothetical protein
MSWVISFAVHSKDPVTNKEVKTPKTLHPITNYTEAENTKKNLENNMNVSNVEMKEDNEQSVG